jgi:hypothetical protein
MRHIGLIISNRIKAINKKTPNNIGTIDAVVVCRKLEEIIQQKSTEHVEVLFYKNKEACIKCFNSFLANELYLRQEEIKEKINKFFGRDVLKKIIFKA